MTHNDFDFYEDLIRPLMVFFVQYNVLNENSESANQNAVKFDEEHFIPPH